MKQENIQAVMEEIGQVTDLLYQEKIDEGYEKLTVLIRNIMTLTADITDEAEQAGFVAVLSPALEAMEHKDYTLLADVLQYDLVEKLEEYCK